MFADYPVNVLTVVLWRTAMGFWRTGMRLRRTAVSLSRAGWSGLARLPALAAAAVRAIRIA